MGTAAVMRPTHRIAFVSSDEGILPTVQESLAPSFHTSFLISSDQLIAFQAETPLDAVILDIDTAGNESQDGCAVLAQLRAEHPDLVLFGITRYRSRGLRLKAEAAGADEMFVSALDFLEMRDLLQ